MPHPNSIVHQAALSIFEFPKPSDPSEAALQAVAREKLLGLLGNGEGALDFVDVIQSGEDIEAILRDAGYQGDLDSRASRVRISRRAEPVQGVDR